MINHNPDKSEIASLYYDNIYSYCNQRLPDKQTAEDITQEVFLALLEEDSLKNPDAILKWLYKVARNKIAAYYRKQYKKHTIIDPNIDIYNVGELPELTVDFTEIYNDDELKECEDIALSQLDASELELYHDIFIDKGKYKDIAKKYNISENALRTRISRLRYKVNHFIKETLYSLLPLALFFSYIKNFFD